MEEFLQRAKSRLADQSKRWEKVHVVLGNKSCDLDTIISTLAYAYYLDKVTAASIFCLPVLNVTKAEFSFCSEMRFILEELDIPESFLVFTDEINLLRLAEEGRLLLTLVNVSVLTSEDDSLIASVVKVINPGKRSDGDQEFRNPSSAIVAKEILKEAPELVSRQLAHLLRGSILFCCLTEHETAHTQEEDILSILEERFCDLLPREDIISNLQETKLHIRGTAIEDIILKEFKELSDGDIKVLVADVHMSLEDLMSHRNSIGDLKVFIDKYEIEILIILASNSSGELHSRQQIAVYSENLELCNQVCCELEECQNPCLDLQPSDNEWDHFLVYNQEGPLVTCDQVSAIIKDAINRRRVGMVPNSRTSSTEAVAGSAPLSQGSSGIMELYGSDVDPQPNPANYSDNQQDVNESLQSQVEVNADLVSPDSGRATIRSSRSSKESSVFLSDDSPVAEVAGLHHHFAHGIDSYSPIPECVITEEETPPFTNNSDNIVLFSFDLVPNARSESSSHSADYSMADDLLFQSDSSEGPQAIQSNHNEAQFYMDSMANCSNSLLQLKVENTSTLEVENISLVDFDDNFMQSPENHEDLCDKKPSVSDLVDYDSHLSLDVLGHAEAKVPPTPMNSLVESSPLDNGPPSFFPNDVIEKINEIGCSGSQGKHEYWWNGHEPEALLKVDTWSSGEQESVFHSPESLKDQTNSHERRNISSFKLGGPTNYRQDKKDDKNAIQENRSFPDVLESRGNETDGYCDPSDNFGKYDNEPNNPWKAFSGEKYFVEMNNVTESRKDDSSENSPDDLMADTFEQNSFEANKMSKKLNLGIKLDINVSNPELEESTDLKHIQRNLCGWDMSDSNHSNAIDDYIAWGDPFLSYRCLDFTTPGTSNDCMVSPPDTNYSTSDTISSPTCEDELNETENVWEEEKSKHTEDCINNEGTILNNECNTHIKHKPNSVVETTSNKMNSLWQDDIPNGADDKMFLPNYKQVSSETDNSSYKSGSDNKLSVANPLDVKQNDDQIGLLARTINNSLPNNLSENLPLANHELYAHFIEDSDSIFKDNDLTNPNINRVSPDKLFHSSESHRKPTCYQNSVTHPPGDKDFDSYCENEDPWGGDLQYDTESSSLNTPDDLSNSTSSNLHNDNLLNDSSSSIKQERPMSNTHIDSIILLSPVNETRLQSNEDLLSPGTYTSHKDTNSEMVLMMRYDKTKNHIRENEYNPANLAPEDTFEDINHETNESVKSDSDLVSGVQELNTNSHYNKSGSSHSISTSPEPVADIWSTTYHMRATNENMDHEVLKNNEQICSPSEMYTNKSDDINNKVPMNLDIWNTQIWEDSESSSSSPETNEELGHPTLLDKHAKVAFERKVQDSDATGLALFDKTNSESNSSTPDTEEETLEEQIEYVSNFSSVDYCVAEKRHPQSPISESNLYQNYFTDSYDDTLDKEAIVSQTIDTFPEASDLPALISPTYLNSEGGDGLSQIASQSSTLSHIEQNHWPTRLGKGADVVTLESSDEVCCEVYSSRESSIYDGINDAYPTNSHTKINEYTRVEELDSPKLCKNSIPHGVTQQGQFKALSDHSDTSSSNSPHVLEVNSLTNSPQHEDSLSFQEPEDINIGILEHYGRFNSSSSSHSDFIPDILDDHTQESSPFLCVEPDLWDMKEKTCNTLSLTESPDVLYSCDTISQASDSPDLCKEYEHFSMYRQHLNTRMRIQSESSNLSQQGQRSRPQMKMSQSKTLSASADNILQTFNTKLKLSSSINESALELDCIDPANNGSVQSDIAESVFSIGYHNDLAQGDQSSRTAGNEFLIKPETSRTVCPAHASYTNHSKGKGRLDYTPCVQAADTEAKGHAAFSDEKLVSSPGGSAGPSNEHIEGLRQALNDGIQECIRSDNPDLSGEHRPAQNTAPYNAAINPANGIVLKGSSLHEDKCDTKVNIFPFKATDVVLDKAMSDSVYSAESPDTFHPISMTNGSEMQTPHESRFHSFHLEEKSFSFLPQRRQSKKKSEETSEHEHSWSIILSQTEASDTSPEDIFTRADIGDGDNLEDMCYEQSEIHDRSPLEVMSDHYGALEESFEVCKLEDSDTNVSIPITGPFIAYENMLQSSISPEDGACVNQFRMYAKETRSVVLDDVGMDIPYDAEEIRPEPPNSLDLNGSHARKIKLTAPNINLSLDHSEGSVLSDDNLDTPDELDINVDDLDTPDEADSFDYTGQDDRPALGHSIQEDFESIREYTAEEERTDNKLWRSVIIGEQEQRIDMKVIEPYKRVISHGGYYGEGVNAIIVFAACFLPDSSHADYNYVMENLFLYVISTLELMVAEDYMIVYLNGATPRRKMPGLGWMKRCYQMIDRRLRKNLKSFIIVHPSWFIRTILAVTRPFISSKFSSKIKYVSSLAELRELIPMDNVQIPESIIKYEESRCFPRNVRLDEELKESEAAKTACLPTEPEMTSLEQEFDKTEEH